MPEAPPVLHLSRHAVQRGKERMRLNEGSLHRMACHAMTKGMPMAETHGHLLRWLQEHAAKHGKGSQTCIRNGIVYVIENNTLITVLFLPREHDRQVQKWMARNPKSAKSSGSLKDPRTGAVTPTPPFRGLKTLKEPLKSPVSGESQPGGGV